MPKNTPYIVQYDGEGNIVLTYREGCEEEIVEEVLESDISSELEFREIPKELREIPQEVEHHGSPRSVLFFQKFHKGNSRMRFASESFRFVGTFTTVFLLLFLSLNFGSYRQMIRASLFPESYKRDSALLTTVSNPFLREKLLPAPNSLPRAGNDLSLLSMIPKVAPPDNRIVIPKIGKNVPIVEVPDHALRRGDFDMFDEDIQNALRYGVVHYPGTASPGEIGNLFLTGHSSNYPWVESKYNAVFALLPSLEVGDEYSVFYQGELYRYRITEKFEVSPRDVSVLAQPNEKRMSTLMTCVPVGTTLKRLILRAEEVMGDEIVEEGSNAL
ncbi:MAG TPA: sortase [Candidatus Peribacterales bacterium]|nr:sortase [Candidatus Peribacterales bacterium]